MLERIPLSYYALSGLFNFITSFALAVFVFSKNPKSSINKIFSILALVVSGWSLFYFFWLTTVEKSYLAEFYLRTLMLFVIFVPSTFTHFILTFLKVDYVKRINLGNYLISLLLGFTVYTRLFAKDICPFFVFPYWLRVGPIFHFHLIHFLVNVIYSHFLMLRAIKHHSGIFRNQVLYIFIGTTIGYTAGVFNYFPWYRLPIPPFLNPLVSIYVASVSYAIIKYRLMDIKVAVTRAGIFLVVYTFILGIPFWVGYQTKFWFIPTVLAVILTAVGPFIYRRLQQKAEAILLAQQKHYQRLLLQAATGMVREHNLDKLLNLIVRVVKNAVKIEFSAVFLKDKKDNCYTLKAIRDHKSFPEALTFSYDHPIIKLIKQRRTPLSYEEISHLFKGSFNKEIHLIVPCFIDENLLGFLALGEKKDRTFYTQDDINVFEILSRQTALAVEYCMFLEEFRQGQEKIFTAEKLASIGGMAGGMAHQIRNRLGVFRACAETLEFTVEEYITKHSKVMEEDIELKGILGDVVKGFNTIVSNVERTAKIVNGIIDFARTQETDIDFSEFVLMEIIDMCIPILKAKHSLGEELPFSLKIEVGSKDTIYGSKGQLAEGMFNFLDNGYEALLEIGLYLSEEEKKSYRPEMKIRLTETKDSYLIEVSDNGIGIKEGDKLKIFSPYFTTKASSISGTGIGMYVIKRIIEENHKGRIWFESTYKKGTKFYIELPKKGSRKE